MKTYIITYWHYNELKKTELEAINIEELINVCILNTEIQSETIISIILVPKTL